MSERGLVSVVIPTYNRVATIERAVDSALAQDYPLVEVLVVFDGSPVDMVDKVAGRYAGDPRVRVLRFPNGGVCVARNHGIREARGEFVAMLDDDDSWLPGKLPLQVRILQAHPELSLVWSDMDAVDPSGQVVSRRYLRKMYGCYHFFPEPLDLFDTTRTTDEGVVYHIGNIAQALVLGNLVHTSTVVARADRLAAAGEYDQSAHPSEDQDYYYRLCKTGPAALIAAVTIRYQVGAADAASAKSRSYELATSSLAVFTRLRELEGGHLRLSPDNLRHAEDELSSWVGDASFRRGRFSEARRHLVRRLMRRPSDLRTLAYLALSCAPYAQTLLHLLRAALGRVRV